MTRILAENIRVCFFVWFYSADVRNTSRLLLFCLIVYFSVLLLLYTSLVVIFVSDSYLSVCDVRVIIIVACLHCNPVSAAFPARYTPDAVGDCLYDIPRTSVDD